MIEFLCMSWKYNWDLSRDVTYVGCSNVRPMRWRGLDAPPPAEAHEWIRFQEDSSNSQIPRWSTQQSRLPPLEHANEHTSSKIRQAKTSPAWAREWAQQASLDWWMNFSLDHLFFAASRLNTPTRYMMSRSAAKSARRTCASVQLTAANVCVEPAEVFNHPPRRKNASNVWVERVKNQLTAANAGRLA